MEARNRVAYEKFSMRSNLDFRPLNGTRGKDATFARLLFTQQFLDGADRRFSRRVFGIYESGESGAVASLGNPFLVVNGWQRCDFIQ
jgi:hypothetical protein